LAASRPAPWDGSQQWVSRNVDASAFIGTIRAAMSHLFCGELTPLCERGHIPSNVASVI
jgi:hypothetical protein